jgi:IrrE N-terminal-like domain
MIRAKEGARPLLILWPFGPVALVYDVQDTEGKDLPRDVVCFAARGAMTQERIGWFIGLMSKKRIGCQPIDAGDGAAGSIRIVTRPKDPKELTTYRILLNHNHNPPVQFATIAHELAHLFLGHLGPDKALSIPERASMNQGQRELEAESVAYLVCARNGVKSRSETYLAGYVTARTTVEAIDVYQVMRAAGQVESLLELTAHTNFSR